MNPASFSLEGLDWITLTTETDRETALAGPGPHPPGHRPARTAGTSTTGAWPPTRKASSGRPWPWPQPGAPMPLRRTGWSTTALRFGLTTAAPADTPGISRLAWSSRTSPSVTTGIFPPFKSRWRPCSVGMGTAASSPDCSDGNPALLVRSTVGNIR